MHKLNEITEENSLKNLVNELDLIDEGCNDIDSSIVQEINLMNENLNISLNSNKSIDNENKNKSALNEAFIEENASNMDLDEKQINQAFSNNEYIEEIKDDHIFNDERGPKEIKCVNNEIDNLIKKEKEILLVEKDSNIYTKKEEKLILSNLKKIKFFINSARRSNSKKKKKRIPIK